MKSIFTLCVVTLLMSTQVFSQSCGGACPTDQTFPCYPNSLTLFEDMGGILPDINCLNYNDPNLGAFSIEAINNLDVLINQGDFTTCGGTATVTFGFRINGDNVLNFLCNAELTIAPVTTFTCPPSRQISCYDEIASFIDPSFLVVSNSCDVPTNVNVGPIAGDPCSDSTFTVDYTISDACNNTYVCTQTFSYLDGPLEVTCPSNTIVACPEDIVPDYYDAVVTGGPDCGPSDYIYVSILGPTLINDIYGSSCSGAQYRVTYLASNGCLEASCEQIFTVDNDPLTVSCIIGDTFETCIANIITPGQNDITISGGCPSANPTVNIVGPTLISGGGNCTGDVYEIVYNVIDDCGNADSCSRLVTISNPAQESICPPDVNLFCIDDFNPVLNAGVSPFPCSYTFQESLVGPTLISGSENCNGSIYEAEYTTTFSCGYSSSCIQTITINNFGLEVYCPSYYYGYNPYVSCASDITPSETDLIIFNDCSLGYSVQIDGPTLVSGVENCPGAQYDVIYTVSDNCGQIQSCTESYIIDGNNGIFVFNTYGYEEYEVDCYDEIILTTENLTISNACNNAYTTIVTGPNLEYYFGLEGCPGYYSVIYDFEDDCGNTRRWIEYWLVTGGDATDITCPANTTVACSSDIIVDANLPTASTSCNLNSTIIPTGPILISGLPECNGSQYEVKYYVNDQCFGIDSCSQIFTIQHPGPTITCPPGATVESFSQIQPFIDISLTTTTATTCYNNPVTTTGPFLIYGSDGQPGSQYEVIYTISNQCQESASCSQFFTIESPDPPEIICPPDASVDCFSDVIPGTPTITDYCQSFDGSGLTIGDPVYAGIDTYGNFLYTILYTYVDACGVSVECIQTFTVPNGLPVTLNCAPDEMVSCSFDIQPTDPTINYPCEPFGVISSSNPTLISGNENCEGAVYEIIYELIDGDFTVATCSQLFTVEAFEVEIYCDYYNDGPSDYYYAQYPETIDCASDIVVDIYSVAVFSNCDIGIDNITAVGPTLINGTADCPGAIYQVEYTAIDDCGNTASCISEYIIDNDDPQIYCSIVYLFDEDDPNANDFYNIPVSCVEDIEIGPYDYFVFSSCGLGYTVDHSDPILTLGTENCNGAVYEVVSTITDDCGRTDSCSTFFSITNDAPTIACNDYSQYEFSEIPVACSSDIVVDQTLLQITTSCELGYTLDFGLPQLIYGTADCPGASYIVEITVTDDCGATATCDQYFVIENDEPTIMCAPDEIVPSVNDIVLVDPTYTVSCGQGTLTFVGPTFIETDPLTGSETYTVIYTIEDDCDRSISCTQTYFTEDCIPECNTDPCLGDIETINPSDPCNCIVDVPQVLGCTDQSACNFNPAANCDDGSCLMTPVCNTDPCLGDIEIINPSDPCNCIVDVPQVLGCTDQSACNFNPAANCDDGSCLMTPVCNTDPCLGDIEIINPSDPCNCIIDVPQVLGCTDQSACNFNPNANCDDSSCMMEPVCNTDPCLGDIQIIDPNDACNCITSIVQTLGCTDPLADNYNQAANCEDGSCEYSELSITDPCYCGNVQNFMIGDQTYFLDVVTVMGATGFTWTVDFTQSIGLFDNVGNPLTGVQTFTETSPGIYTLNLWSLETVGFTLYTNNGNYELFISNSCDPCPIDGCTDPLACNFDPTATNDDGSCMMFPVCNTDPCVGDIEIINPNDDCSCIVDMPQVLGCTDDSAINYDPIANCDDGSCDYCPVLEAITFSTNSICSEDLVLFNASLQTIQAASFNVYIGDENGTLVTSLIDVNNNGVFIGEYELTNTTCEPIDIQFTIEGICTNDGSTIGLATETVTVYPIDISQFVGIATSDDGCTLTAEVMNCDDANGQPILNVVAPNVQGPANPGESGIYTFCFEYDDDIANACVATNCFDFAYNCNDCDINAGTLTGNSFLCEDEFVIANAIGTENILTGCVLLYVLHDGFDVATGNVLATSVNGVFTNDGSYPYNQDLCITAVAGCDLLANGLPDPFGDCYDESNCLATVFIEPISIVTEEICDPATGTYMVNFTISGGGPAYLPDVHTYEIVGDYNNPAAEAGSYSFGPFPSAYVYSFDVIEDGKGCTASATGTSSCGQFDLALVKTVTSNQNTIEVGDIVTFTITAINQGSIDAQNILIVDYIPSNMVLAPNNSGWSLVGTDAMFMLNTLPSGNQTSFNIELIVLESGFAVNVAEIAGAQDINGNNMADIDSTPDADNSNDAGGGVNTMADDAVFGNGSGQVGGSNPMTDEDDSDPAFIIVEDLCSNNAGTMSQAILSACFNSSITIATQGTFIDPGSTIAYYLHDSPVGIGNILANNNIGTFVNDGSVTTNAELYVTVVVGPIGTDGSPILTDECTSISQNTPVRFFNPIIINHNYICDVETGDYQVIYDISGGAPSFPGSNQTYQIGGIDFTDVAPNTVYISMVDGDAIGYNIVVINDGNGCTAGVADVFEPCFILPIELISFTGEVIEPGNQLKWQTATEINNDYFILERSNDNGINWTEIDNQIGAGNTTVVQNYEYLDRDAPAGLSLYRLWQVDYDGSTSYVGLVELIRGEKIFELIYVHFDIELDNLNVSLNSNIEKEVTIQIINAAGQIMTTEIMMLNFDLNNFDINLTDIADGLHVISISDGNILLHNKFIKN